MGFDPVQAGNLSRRRRWPGVRLLAILFVAPFLAGCLDAHTVHYSISGAFTDERTSLDMADLEATTRPFSLDLAIMESFPEQFRVGTLHERECGELHDILAAKEYLASVGACTADA